MQAITTVGLDIAKSVFQVHALMRKANDHFCGFSPRSRRSTLKDHRDEAITHTGRIVSIALILIKQ